jgi:hypothetical protein
VRGWRAYRTGDFDRRSRLYTRCDIQLREYTRFFAAAAAVNSVLARYFAVLPVIRSPRTFIFLNEVGTALESRNLIYARQIGSGVSGTALDHALVRNEQALLQRYVYAQKTHASQQWESTRRELNQMLNGRYATMFFCPWCEGSERLSRVLRDVRRHFGTELDFASESHRVWIGRRLIEDIRGVSANILTATPHRGSWPAAMNRASDATSQEHARLHAMG